MPTAPTASCSWKQVSQSRSRESTGTIDPAKSGSVLVDRKMEFRPVGANP
jgi:hypothetical protein